MINGTGNNVWPQSPSWSLWLSCQAKNISSVHWKNTIVTSAKSQYLRMFPLSQHQIVNKLGTFSLGFSYFTQEDNLSCWQTANKSGSTLTSTPLPVVALIPISSCLIVSLSPKYANDVLRWCSFLLQICPHFRCVESAKSLPSGKLTWLWKITTSIYHVSWVNPLLLRSFSIANC